MARAATSGTMSFVARFIVVLLVGLNGAAHGGRAAPRSLALGWRCRTSGRRETPPAVAGDPSERLPGPIRRSYRIGCGRVDRKVGCPAGRAGRASAVRERALLGLPAVELLARAVGRRIHLIAVLRRTRGELDHVTVGIAKVDRMD